MIVAALVVPVGFALSLSSGTSRPQTSIRTAVPVEAVAMSGHVLVAREAAPERAPFDDVPDAAKLFFVGTMLIGVAIAARRAV